MPTSTATKESKMLRALAFILSLALAGSAFAHSDSKWTKGPAGRSHRRCRWWQAALGARRQGQ